MTDTVLPDWLHHRARLSPQQPALTAGDERLTFAALDERVSGVAGWLVSQGVRPGDRVALVMNNGAALAILVHAVGRTGAVLVPLNTRLNPAEIKWQLEDSGARLVIADLKNMGTVQAAARDLIDLRILSAAELKSRPGPQPGLVHLDAPHTILYTSGTTGRPKGALLTFGNHWWSAVGSALNLGLYAGDCWLAVLPLFHIGGLAILMRGVIYGHTVIVHEKFDPAAVNWAVDVEAVTIVSMVATMLQRTLDDRGARPFPPTLRCVLLGGGPAPRPLLEECARRGLPVVQTYGLTEAASQVATLAPADALRKLGSAGKPLLPTELRIDGAPGEIVIRGPALTPGYLNNPEANVRAFRQGWFHTGDLGYLDEEGYLYVLDRREDLIISGGENVYPAEIESVLREHPAVIDAGVVGVPDPRWGQAPAAFVVLREAVSEADLRSFCRERLAGFKIPARIRFLDALPRNSSGKLLRRSLLDDVTPG